MTQSCVETPAQVMERARKGVCLPKLRGGGRASAAATQIRPPRAGRLDSHKAIEWIVSLWHLARRLRACSVE